MMRVFSQFGRLIALCLKGSNSVATLGLFVVVLALKLGGIYAGVALINWTKAFYDALQKVDAAGAIRQLGIFALIVALNATRHLVSEVLRKILDMRWRTNLTHAALDIWMSNKAYWHLAQKRDGIIDNPDQRIADDSRLFVNGMLTEVIDIIEGVVGLFTYLAILWSLSNFPLSFSLGSYDVEIPRYMVWAAFLYVALSSGLTHVLGKPLKGLIAQQQKREADFRFAMARWRGHMDEVALSNGEGHERATFNSRFEAIVSNWRSLIRRELILGSFTWPYYSTVMRIPLFLALPAYFAGNVAFGGLMQLAMAFTNVVTTLSWFIFSYRKIAEVVAASSRLDNFLQTAKGATPPAPVFTRLAAEQGGYISDIRVALPDGRELLQIPQLDIAPGKALWFEGPSGIGKTTLTKAMAGLWTWGAGKVALPADAMFLPQKAYMPIGTILDAVAYPKRTSEFDPSDLTQALRDVGLEHRLEQTNLDGLSGGELQRLALARVLVHRPSLVVMDEATSALDTEAERILLTKIAHQLPSMSIILIAHRKPEGLKAMRTYRLDRLRSFLTHPNAA